MMSAVRATCCATVAGGAGAVDAFEKISSSVESVEKTHLRHAHLALNECWLTS
jgi:hypothetical protein